MLNQIKKMVCRSALVGGLGMAMTCLASADVTTVSFQNGVNDYWGTFDRMICDVTANEVDGSEVTTKYLDGFHLGDGFGDSQYLIRFDDIIGDANDQIPQGATILNAELIVNTSLAGSAATNGPYGVAALLQEFNSSTSYFADFSSTTNLISRGAWWQDGSATRPVGCYGWQVQGQVTGATVTSLVQTWVDGSLPNHGFVIQAGLSDSIDVQASTTDGWSIRTTGYPISDNRPALSVTYTMADVTTTRFQEGLDGYAGTTMAIVNGGSNALILDGAEDVNDGAELEMTWLDGIYFSNIDGTNSSPDIFALLKFDNLFGSESWQAPNDVPVAKAWVVITTASASKDARTCGAYASYTMRRDWDTTTQHYSFGEINGLQIGDNDIAGPLGIQEGFIRGAEVWLEVTDYVEGVRNGAIDYGIAIKDVNTQDGWQIYTTGCSDIEVRPRLVIYSGDLDLDN